MKPVRTPESNTVYTLPGGNEDNWLHAEETGGVVKSVWQATPEERRLIAGGAPIVLLIYGALVPPVSIGIERPFCPDCKQQMQWDPERQLYGCHHEPPAE